jgi:hypothetical protein
MENWREKGTFVGLVSTLSSTHNLNGKWSWPAVGPLAWGLNLEVLFDRFLVKGIVRDVLSAILASRWFVSRNVLGHRKHPTINYVRHRRNHTYE